MCVGCLREARSNASSTFRDGPRSLTTTRTTTTTTTANYGRWQANMNALSQLAFARTECTRTCRVHIFGIIISVTARARSQHNRFAELLPSFVVVFVVAVVSSCACLLRALLDAFKPANGRSSAQPGPGTQLERNVRRRGLQFAYPFRCGCADDRVASIRMCEPNAIRAKVRHVRWIRSVS